MQKQTISRNMLIKFKVIEKKKNVCHNIIETMKKHKLISQLYSSTIREEIKTGN